MVWSLSKGSSGPRPKISSRISRESRSRSAKLRGTTSLLTELRMRTRTSSRAEFPVERPSFSRSSLEYLPVQVGLYLLVLAALEGLQIRHKSLHRLEQRPRGSFYV